MGQNKIKVEPVSAKADQLSEKFLIVNAAQKKI